MTASVPLCLGLFLVPCALSWLLTFLLIRWAPRLGLVDLPGERKVHTEPKPRGGGLAIYAALLAAACIFPATLHQEFLLSLGAGVIIVVLGLVDDLRPLPWQLRIGVQALVAAAAVLLFPSEAFWPVKVCAVVWVVGLINAFNMLDNMDALSAGVAWIAAAMLALSVAIQDNGAGWQAGLPYLMFMGALTGFLWFNWPPARIFMGDAGSTFLGLFIGLGSLKDVFSDRWPSPRWGVPVMILAVPWYDLISVVVLRLAQGRSPFHADKQHLSHRLVALGLSSRSAVLVVYRLALASGLSGLALLLVPPWGAAVVGLQLLCLWLGVAGIEYVRHFGKEAN